MVNRSPVRSDFQVPHDITSHTEVGGNDPPPDKFYKFMDLPGIEPGPVANGSYHV
jgi:hypothetical protein